MHKNVLVLIICFWLSYDCFMVLVECCMVFFFKQKTAYEMRISDWSSDVCSSDLLVGVDANAHRQALDDLGEVARGVVWRDSRIADATGRPQAFHGSLQYGTRQGVHLDVHRLSGPYTRQLRLAEVGRDVNRVERAHRPQWLAGIHECADAPRLLTDHAVDGRRD